MIHLHPLMGEACITLLLFSIAVKALHMECSNAVRSNVYYLFNMQCLHEQTEVEIELHLLSKQTEYVKCKLNDKLKSCLSLLPLPSIDPSLDCWQPASAFSSASPCCLCTSYKSLVTFESVTVCACSSVVSILLNLNSRELLQPAFVFLRVVSTFFKCHTFTCKFTDLNV